MQGTYFYLGWLRRLQGRHKEATRLLLRARSLSGEPGGVLVMRFMISWREGDPKQTDWKLTGEAVKLEDGAIVRRWSRASYDVENQLANSEDRYEVTGGDVTLDARWRLLAGNGKELALKRTTLTETAAGPGYEPLVAAMDRALATLAQQIAVEIRATPR
jgi:hypothetical protein